jgi:signal transduction histidine kinase
MSAERRIRIGFLLLTLAPVCLGWLAWQSAQGVVEARDDVARTNELVKRLEMLLSSLKDVEVAQREYILTGDDEYVQQIRKARGAVETEIERLPSIGAQAHWIELLRTLIPQKFEEIEQTVELRRTGDFEAASNVILRNRGSQAMDDIRTSVRSMITQENVNLAKRGREQEANFRTAMTLFVIVLLFSVAMVALLFYLTQREARELERRVALRTEELQRSNEDLQQFAYIASHDLKEPMRMIASYATLLQRRYQSRLDEDADTYIGFIVDGVRRMNLLINDLLDYSRAGQLTDEQPSPVDPTQVLKGVLDNLKVTIADAGAIVTHDPLPIISYDQTRLAQLLQNLIGNAIKYRGEKKPVIHLWADTTETETIFAVTDNGPGIPPEHHETIFGIFQRLHGKDVEGTGIGLAMCRRIVERHGGRIWVESTPGAGSTFRFTVPHVQPVANTAAG